MEREGGFAGEARPVAAGQVGDRKERLPGILGAIVESLRKIGVPIGKLVITRRPRLESLAEGLCLSLSHPRAEARD